MSDAVFLPEESLYIIGDLNGDLRSLRLFLDDAACTADTARTMVVLGGMTGLLRKQLDDLTHFLPGGFSIFLHGGTSCSDDLSAYAGLSEVTELRDNIFYCPFGSTLTLADMRILFVGKMHTLDFERTTAWNAALEKITPEEELRALYSVADEDNPLPEFVVSCLPPTEILRMICAGLPKKDYRYARLKDCNLSALDGIQNRSQHLCWFYTSMQKAGRHYDAEGHLYVGLEPLSYSSKSLAFFYNGALRLPF